MWNTSPSAKTIRRSETIWALVGRLNLSAFFIKAIEGSTEEGGRPAFDPQLLDPVCGSTPIARG